MGAKFSGGLIAQAGAQALEVLARLLNMMEAWLLLY